MEDDKKIILIRYEDTIIADQASKKRKIQSSDAAMSALEDMMGSVSLAPFHDDDNILRLTKGDGKIMLRNYKGDTLYGKLLYMDSFVLPNKEYTLQICNYSVYDEDFILLSYYYN